MNCIESEARSSLGKKLALTLSLSPRRGESHRMIFVKGMFAGRRLSMGRSTKSGVIALLNNIRIGTRQGEVRTALQNASAIGTRFIAHVPLRVGGCRFP
jgi:hypothetical protein